MAMKQVDLYRQMIEGKIHDHFSIDKGFIVKM